MMAVASITVSSRLHPGQSVRALLAAAILLIAIANAVCALPGTTAWMLAVARAATGLGEGTVMATAAAVVASTADPHRVFSMIGTAVAIIAALALVATPWLMTVTGARSIFWVLTAVPLLLLPSLSRIQRLKEPHGTSVVRLCRRAAVVGHDAACFLLLWCGASGLKQPPRGNAWLLRNRRVPRLLLDHVRRTPFAAGWPRSIRADARRRICGFYTWVSVSRRSRRRRHRAGEGHARRILCITVSPSLHLLQTRAARERGLGEPKTSGLARASWNRMSARRRLPPRI